MKQSDKNQENQLLHILRYDSIVPGSFVVLLFLSSGSVVIDNVRSIAVLFGRGDIVHHHRGHIGFSVYDVPVLVQSTNIAHPALVKSIPHLATVQVYSTLACVVSTVIVQSINDRVSFWGLFVIVVGHYFGLLVVVGDFENFLLLFQFLDFFFQLFDQSLVLFFPLIVFFLHYLHLLEIAGFVDVWCWG